MLKYPQVRRTVGIAKRVDLDSNAELQKAIADVQAELGNRGRVLVRASGTEPVIRVMVESESRSEARAVRRAARRRRRHSARESVSSERATDRHVFFVSDSTGITVETLGNALLSQFDHLHFITTTIPFVTDEDQAAAVVDRIDTVEHENPGRPLVFSTFADLKLRRIIVRSNALVLDMFQVFIGTLEQELHVGSSHALGRYHAVTGKANYDDRIGAVEFALSHDDGAGTRSYGDADVILVGVSRSGKTPTCVYLAMQFGIRTANYPLTDDVLSVFRHYRRRCCRTVRDCSDSPSNRDGCRRFVPSGDRVPYIRRLRGAGARCARRRHCSRTTGFHASIRAPRRSRKLRRACCCEWGLRRRAY